MNPDRTQRWRDGRASWRPASEGGFNPDDYDVVSIDEATAEAFVTRHHYARTWPSTTLRYALHDHRPGQPLLAGVLTLGVGMSKRALTNPFPALTPYAESLELSRLVLLDSVPANAESWFCARAFALAADRGVRGVITFADPTARWRRTPAGLQLVKRGHVGIVYQALGFTYLGRNAARTVDVLPDETVLFARSRSKVRNGERGGAGVVRRLVALGAPEPEPGVAPADWLPAALAAIGATKERHPGNHKYALRIGSRPQRTRTVIAAPAQPYPKPDLQLQLAIA